MFPLRSQHLIKSKQLRRSVHLIEVLVVLVCGLLPSVIIISTSGYQYIGFPPVCTNEIPEVLFYTLIFPISIEAIFGLCMLLISLWILRKVAIISGNYMYVASNCIVQYLSICLSICIHISL